ncbi:MAG: class I SAM-dependent methyltransferase [Acidobacteriota bacterium]
MDEKFWDSLAANYDEEVFDTLKNDKHGILAKYIDRFASSEHQATDFGCGVGKYLPTLAKRFHKVYAIDHSQKCLDVAKKSCEEFSNIRFLKCDLSNGELRIPKAHFAINTNVIIMPSPEKRLAILQNLSRKIVKGGHLLLLAPSVESVLYTQFRIAEWFAKLNKRRKNPLYEKLSDGSLKNFSIPNGILNIENVATKHYVKEELLVLLHRVGLEVKSFEKVEYDWRLELDESADELTPPYPWDWLVVCEKVR